MKKVWTRELLIKKYIEFFKSKKHKEIPSSSLIPENDPTVLFTTAGMHPLVPYLLGEKHPLGKRLVNVQKCIRTGDIDEVGDEVHHTFFEMLGNWSLGNYWKKEAIEFSFEFLTKVLKIPEEKLGITVFGGDKRINQIAKDNESFEIWKSLGIKEEKIAFIEGGVLESDNNWWGPAGETGPCGACTEMFYWTGKEKTPRKFNPSDKNWVEIGNDVLMEYEKTKDRKYIPLKQKNIDFGGGVERTVAVLNNLNDNYLIPSLKKIIEKIEKISKKKYENNKREMRIIADHIRASVFILGERKIKPGNTGQSYVLRRLIRRAVRYGKISGIKESFTSKVSEIIIEEYKKDYPELKQNKNFIINELNTEEEKFSMTLEKGLKKFNNLRKGKQINGKDTFLLFQSYGFPIEMTSELAKENKIKVDIQGFNKEFEKHQNLSKTASAGQFKSGLADNSEMTKKLHTATHLLNAALKKVLKSEEIKQKGSNITPERLRFDFSFERKLTDKELKKIEELVNKWIFQGIEVAKEEMPVKEAFDSGAEGEFGAKYPSIVSVYTIKGVSKEICTGPHVSNTKEIGKFKIIKEESSSARVRRIKAILE